MTPKRLADLLGFPARVASAPLAPLAPWDSMRSIWHRRETVADPAPAADAPAGILVVCTANVCRSPVAEALLRQRIADAGLAVPVRSAGTHAQSDLPVTDGMRRATAPVELDLDDHRSRPVTRDLALAHQLVVTMEARHRELVTRMDPTLAARTFTLPELAVLAGAVDTTIVPAGDLPALVTALHHTRPRVLVEDTDVDDPYGGPEEGYPRTVRRLQDLVDPVATLLVVHLRARH